MESSVFLGWRDWKFISNALTWFNRGIPLCVSYIIYYSADYSPSHENVTEGSYANNKQVHLSAKYLFGIFYVSDTSPTSRDKPVRKRLALVDGTDIGLSQFWLLSHCSTWHEIWPNSPRDSCSHLLKASCYSLYCSPLNSLCSFPTTWLPERKVHWFWKPWTSYPNFTHCPSLQNPKPL